MGINEVYDLPATSLHHHPPRLHHRYIDLPLEYELYRIMDQFHEVTKNLELFLLDWARPDGWKESPLANYPLANFDAAVTVALGYLCFVIFGSVSEGP